MGLARESLHLDQRHRVGCLPRRVLCSCCWAFSDVDNSIWFWATPIISGGFLAITGGLLLWDLEHPERFYLIFTRPQWRSWLVKGAFIIAGYTLVLAAALHRELGWIDFVSELADDCRNSVGDSDGHLHRLSFRASKGARHVAKPAAAAASVFPVGLLGSAVLLPLLIISENTSAVERFLGFVRPEALAVVDSGDHEPRFIC